VELKVIMLDNTESVLEKIGLTQNEAKVYLTLLKFGQLKAGRISKEASINRTSAYDAIKRLLEKGLISYVVIANRKLFKAVNPKRLSEYIEEKKEEIESVLPYLEGLHKESKSEQHVTLYTGYKGVQSVYQDILRKKKPIDVFGSEGQLGERMPWYVNKFVNEVEKNKIPIRMITRAGRKNSSPTKTTKVRYAPVETRSSAITNIYGNKIAIIVWAEQPEAIIIENEQAASSYRNYFELLWKIAKEKNE